MQTYDYEVIVLIEPDGDGYYAHCPGLSGVHVYGDTKEEALKNAKDAAKAILDTMIEHGNTINEGPHLKKSTATLKQFTSTVKDQDITVIVNVSTPASA